MGSIGHISKKRVVESWGFLPKNRPVSGTWRISEYRNTRFRKIGFTLAFLDMARKNKINCQRWMYCMLRGLLWLTWLYCQGPCIFLMLTLVATIPCHIPKQFLGSKNISSDCLFSTPEGVKTWCVLPGWWNYKFMRTPSPPKTNGWNLKIRPVEKEKHLQTTHCLGFHVNFPGYNPVIAI